MKEDKDKTLVESVIDAYQNTQDKYSDPEGSYTGVPANVHDKPVQDADDL